MMNNNINQGFHKSQTWQYSHIFAVFVFLFSPFYVSKCEIRCQWVYEDYILRLKTSLVLFMSNVIAKLVILASLYCKEL